MTTLSTHDTKRSSDVRGRLATLLEYPREWERTVAELERACADQRAGVDAATANLLWQTLAATWRMPGALAAETPISEQRLTDYLTKAVREAKTHTTWTDPDQTYETAVLDLARAALTDESVAAALDAFTSATEEAARATILGRKLVQLTMPGVPDVYQGSEAIDLSLVDPDNRRQVDFDHREALLRQIWDTDLPQAQGHRYSLDAAKLAVTSAALRCRRDHPDAFRGPHAVYRPVPTTTGHAVAFARGVSRGEEGTTGSRPSGSLPDHQAAAHHGDPVNASADELVDIAAITVATRLPGALAARGGWGDHRVVLPERAHRDLLTGTEWPGGSLRLADLLETLPVALLVPQN